MRGLLETAAEPWMLSAVSLALAVDKRRTPGECARFAVATPLASLASKRLQTRDEARRRRDAQRGGRA